ncbi:LysR family transcriptional regulator substrate-binding protein [Nocardioides sp. ChNu-99]|uniref:LysR family transcriptional regulator substrate-binding protein n=1 Tax=Nocardioides sp. ChNu-99 TaxID=2839897 RepID=UPI002404C8B7|nr:LysR family transcriptional regulator substrate-binding protein [Nocardioides sp. ChNu-99]
MTTIFRLGFVDGATPDKWAARWRERHPRERLELVPVTASDQERVLRDDEVDMCLVRLPVATDGLHVVRLYDEQQVVVAGLDHVVGAVEEVELADLADEQLVTDPARVPGWHEVARVERLPWPVMSDREAVEVAASGSGVAVLPLAVARLHHRKDVVHRPVTDLPPTTVALAWRVERDDDRTQEMVGITKGRTARSSRG